MLRPTTGLLLLLAWAPPAQAQASATRGASLYQQVCAQCHDSDPRRDRPRQAIGVPEGVLTALQTISPMRFLQSVLDPRDIADIQAWLDTLGEGWIRDTRALSGSWYDPASAGQGFSFSVLPGEVFSLIFYGHRDDGSNLVLVGNRVQRPRYGEAFEIELLGVQGGRFGGFDPAAILLPRWGLLQLRFLDCRRAEAWMQGADGEQRLQLQALTPIEGLVCD